jgi:hypothetical protein
MQHALTLGTYYVDHLDRKPECCVVQGCQMVYFKDQFRYILEGLGMENVGIVHGHLA